MSNMSDKVSNETDVSACEDNVVGTEAGVGAKTGAKTEQHGSKSTGAAGAGSDASQVSADSAASADCDAGAAGADATHAGEDATDANADEAAGASADADAPVASTTEDSTQNGEECAETEPSSPDLGAQLAEMQDKYLRLQAEWDNFRKRTATEREQERSRANERLVSNLLQVVDDMERAIAGFTGKEDDPMLAGIKAVYSKFVDVLTREGLQAIDPQRGDAFDIHNHQAVSKVEDASMPNDSIVEVYQKGYIMGEKNLRPAMVVVSSGGPKRED